MPLNPYGCRLISSVAPISNELLQEVINLDPYYHSHPKSKSGWSALPLRNFGGCPDQAGIIPRNSIGLSSNKILSSGLSVQDTKWLTPRSPYLTQLITKIVTELDGKARLIRLMKLKAKSEIPRHLDGGLFNLEFGQFARFHLPIFTDSDNTEFQIGPKTYRLEVGKLYFTDVSIVHSVKNQGTLDRIHLVIDMEMTPELRKIIVNHSIEPDFQKKNN